MTVRHCATLFPVKPLKVFAKDISHHGLRLQVDIESSELGLSLALAGGRRDGIGSPFLSGWNCRRQDLMKTILEDSQVQGSLYGRIQHAWSNIYTPDIRLHTMVLKCRGCYQRLHAKPIHCI